jgi:hypothetical protein
MTQRLLYRCRACAKNARVCVGKIDLAQTDSVLAPAYARACRFSVRCCTVPRQRTNAPRFQTIAVPLAPPPLPAPHNGASETEQEENP